MKNATIMKSTSGRTSNFMFLLIFSIFISIPWSGKCDDSIDFTYSFGIHPSSEDNYTYAKDLGINFNREGVYLVWDWVDTDKNGNFSLKNATAAPRDDDPAEEEYIINYDDERQRLLDIDGIPLMNNICPFQAEDQFENEFQNEEEKAIYQSFVKKVVERYDGDSDLGCSIDNGIDCYNSGDNEFPDQDLISILQTNSIKYWQVCNDVMDVCDGDECEVDENYAQKYAEVMELTYTAVKESCPDCQVLIAGDSSKDLYPAVYDLLAGNYIDIIDKHFFDYNGDYANIPEEMDFLNYKLESAGFDLDKLRFWITETGTYSGQPVDDRDVDEEEKETPPYQTEKEQAQELIKRYAVSFGYGIEKVLWAWGVKDGFNCECCKFDYTGLIYEGNSGPDTCDEDGISDRGEGVKKLAYFSYKMMTQKLKDFISVETTTSSNGTYVYKFINNEGGSVYIGWSENGESLTLTGIESNSIKITPTVPDFEYGDQIADFNSAFVSDIKAVSNGSVIIDLNEVPLYIEEYQYTLRSFIPIFLLLLK
ncbi:hypothetical protein KKHLCK_03565 [Candidatus Electrothrix laxa]